MAENTPDNPVRLGLTGLGGWSALTCERLLQEPAQAAPKAVLGAVCEPNTARWGEWSGKLRDAGVQLVEDFDQFLKTDIEIVWLPLPIHLHGPYTERALAAGKAVMCEKPAAGTVDDVDAMIAARDRTGLFAAIAYQDAYQPAVWELKRRLVKGEFGVILSASVLGCWPRGEWYYKRNYWAGKIASDGKWVLDSPASNALAHYIHLAQFLLGRTEYEAASPTEVEAELYRANPIENYDTCSMRLTFDGGSHLLINLTHACRTSIEPEVIIRTQFARIRYLIHELRIEIQTPTKTETLDLKSDRHGMVVDTIHRALRMGNTEGPIGTLEMARTHTVAMNAASEATAIIDVPPDQVEMTTDAQGRSLRTIRGIEQAMQSSIRQGRMLHEGRFLPWTGPAGDIDTRGYFHFKGPRRESGSR